MGLQFIPIPFHALHIIFDAIAIINHLEALIRDILSVQLNIIHMNTKIKASGPLKKKIVFVYARVNAKHALKNTDPTVSTATTVTVTDTYTFGYKSGF